MKLTFPSGEEMETSAVDRVEIKKELIFPRLLDLAPGHVYIPSFLLSLHKGERSLELTCNSLEDAEHIAKSVIKFME